MPTASANASPDRASATIAALAVTATSCFLIVPRTTPAVLALLAAFVVTASMRPPAFSPSWKMPQALALLLALGLWAALSSTWAADPPEAIGKAALLIVFSAVAFWTLAQLPASRTALLRHGAWIALVAFGACLAFLALEEATNHVVKRQFFHMLPFTRPPARHVVATENDLQIAGYITNRNMAAAMLGLWPMLLMVRALVDRERSLVASAALAVLAVATFAMSMHETSSIAFAASVLVFAIGLRWPKAALSLVTAGWLLATLSVVPLATWAGSTAQLHSAQWLPNSARHRIVLWEYTAQHYWQRPLTGIGAASTKVLDNRRGVDVEVKPGTRYQWRSGTHAHNMYLQTWYELGAVGALLLCLAGLSLIAAASRLPRSTVPYATAAFTAAAVMGASTWGFWQVWFMAAFAVSSVLLGIAIRLLESSPASADNPKL